MTKKQKILIISHGHPEISRGGAENVAYNLFMELQGREDYETVFLAYDVSCSSSHLGTHFKTRTSNGSEIILSGGNFDYFLFSQLSSPLVWRDFRNFLDSFQPTIVHFHHYIHLGLELIREIRKFSEDILIVVTLHEYLAICHHNGQMVKTSNYKLCYKSSPIDCHHCFPNKTIEEFQLIELYIKSFFNLVDVFTSPSNFLLNRYTDWGIAKEKILYLDNGQSFISEASSQNFSSEEVKICFSYFGQISTYKGIIVLLAAIEKLPKKMRETIRLDIHGANLELQPKAFQDKVFQILDKTKDCVQFLGPYRPDELPKLMAKVDWVIVPSIWWENAPLVIEEAFIHKRPVICSNIGGMAEKVEHEKSGLHFQVGDATDLAACIIRAATEEGLWDKLSNGISDRLTIKEMTDRTLDIYRQFQADRFKKSGL